jgi:signal transduction histidine kinase/ActR/RegA family two-component response regulator
MKVVLTTTAVLFVVVLLTWLSLNAVNSDAEQFDRALSTLDRFAMTESALYRDVLSARAGILRNYDPLVREIASMDESLARLRDQAPHDAGAVRSLDRLSAVVQQQEDLIEQFKSDNALLQNSLAYFGKFSARLDQDEPVVAAVDALASAMLQFTLDTSLATGRQVEDRLDELTKRSAQSTDAQSLRALLAHAKLLRELLPATDATLSTLQALPRKEIQGAVRASILTSQSASRETARRYRLLLYLASLLLLGVLTHLGLRLRDRARALQRRAALEHVIAGISTRLINARPMEMRAHVERALGELAACVGADRAYLVMAGAPASVHVWCGERIACPATWPEMARVLAEGMGEPMKGIIRVPKVGSLPASAIKTALVSAGLKGWAGVVSKNGAGGMSSLLGFDAVRSRIQAESSELSLLLVAIEAIANALARNRIEQERLRLAARLEQSRRMETVGALASGIAHNFNNILGAILGHAEMAEDQLGADGRQDGHILAIRQAGLRARDLVDQILTFGRRRDARRRPVNVAAIVAETAALLRASLPAGIEFTIRAGDQAATIIGEPAQLQQVILNLCNNAMQAMDNEGRLELDTGVRDSSRTVSLTHGALEPGRYVRIAVRDTGRGIDEATLERIFEPFFTTRSAGNGLGLATVREIVREHGGAMNVWSRLGTGSRFEVWIPCSNAAPDAVDEPSPALPLGHGETLMLIDDDRARLLRDEELLAALGYEPVGFARGEAALDACRRTPERFDAVIVGHFGAARTALDVVSALRGAAPLLPILVATASADEIAADELIAAGGSEIVRRPLHSGEVAAALKRGLARHKRLVSTLQS